MPTFVTLAHWTDQGIKNIKELNQRADAVRDLASRLGGELREVYVVMGRYDVVAISELPDDETATKLALAVGAQGNTRTETLRAYTLGEMSSIIADIP